MADVNEAINQIKSMLSDEDGKDRVQNIINMLIDSSKSEAKTDAEVDINDNNDDDDYNDYSDDSDAKEKNTFDFENIEMFMKAQKIFKKISHKTGNNHEIFLKSLKPYLTQKRADKIDSAVKILSMTKMASIFKEINSDEKG